MKKVLSLALISAFVISFSSCIKTIDEPARPQTDPISGSWYVSDASVNDGDGWYSFNANLYGIFTFYDNGTAQYVDNTISMQGNWYTDVVSDSYYDSYGNFQNDVHKNFQVHVSNSDGNYVDLNFDDISFAGNNQFVATYYDGKSIERYTFSRN